jgi:rhamnosyltransferase
MTIGVAFITLNAEKHLRHCLPPILNSALKPRVMVVDSSSTDGTVEKAQQIGSETLIVLRSSFNHGATREMARRHLATDIAIMMTPDAYATNNLFVERLVAPLLNGSASVSYARQLPRRGADIFEAFPREFNYPTESHSRGIEDLPRYGVYTYFCSDSAPRG